MFALLPWLWRGCRFLPPPDEPEEDPVSRMHHRCAVVRLRGKVGREGLAHRVGEIPPVDEPVLHHHRARVDLEPRVRGGVDLVVHFAQEVQELPVIGRAVVVVGPPCGVVQRVVARGADEDRPEQPHLHLLVDVGPAVVGERPRARGKERVRDGPPRLRLRGDRSPDAGGGGHVLHPREDDRNRLGQAVAEGDRDGVPLVDDQGRPGILDLPGIPVREAPEEDPVEVPARDISRPGVEGEGVSHQPVDGGGSGPRSQERRRRKEEDPRQESAISTAHVVPPRAER